MGTYRIGPGACIEGIISSVQKLHGWHEFRKVLPSVGELVPPLLLDYFLLIDKVYSPYMPHFLVYEVALEYVVFERWQRVISTVWVPELVLESCAVVSYFHLLWPCLV